MFLPFSLKPVLVMHLMCIYNTDIVQCGIVDLTTKCLRVIFLAMHSLLRLCCPGFFAHFTSQSEHAYFVLTNLVLDFFSFTLSSPLPPSHTRPAGSYQLSSRSASLSPPRSCPCPDCTFLIMTHKFVVPARIVRTARLDGFDSLLILGDLRTQTVCAVGEVRVRRAFGAVCGLSEVWRGVRGGGGGRWSGL
jgi:hypothetical protein